MTHYILVHGAWEAAWSWNETRPVLEQHGHKVTAIDLPGTKANDRAVAQVTMDSYVQTVADVIRAQDHKVTLVGHSLAGAVISQVAELMPEKIERLIYAAGFLLKDGDSVIEAMQRDPDGEFLPELVFSEDQSSVTATPQVWRDKAFHDVEEIKTVEVLPLVDHAQSTEPFAAKVRLSEEEFGSVPKIYIRTALDKMVSPKLQDEMVENWRVDTVHVLQAGHFPTLSMPEKLANLMLQKILEPA
ncbi:MAG: pimeloyl-ACP methyl ester carboxylesterase [Mariniblastus sp.]|jgi:pimeloyl-ACP methyl ester carboxylesterase